MSLQTFPGDNSTPWYGRIWENECKEQRVGDDLHFPFLSFLSICADVILILSSDGQNVPDGRHSINLKHPVCPLMNNQNQNKCRYVKFPYESKLCTFYSGFNDLRCIVLL